MIELGVPRKHPVPEREKAIGQRLKQARLLRGWSRQRLAERAGTSASTLKRIELGRVPLRYDLARVLTSWLRLNPVWLATGRGPQNRRVGVLPDASTLHEPQQALFSEIFERLLQAELESPDERQTAKGSDAFARVDSWGELEHVSRTWFKDVPDGHVQEFLDALENHAEQLLKQWPQDDWPRAVRRSAAFEAMAQMAQTPSNRDSGEPGGKQGHLTHVTDSAKLTDVRAKPRLPGLLEQLRGATKERGMKSALAEFLGVPLANVSQWLAGAREPSGEYVLQMEAWLELPESKRKAK